MKLFHFLFLFNSLVKLSSSVPFLIPASGVAIAGIVSGYWYLKCSLFECCNSSDEKKNLWILYDEHRFQQLDKDLRKNLHGQHLVIDLVVNAVRNHWRDETPIKPLVMSFHGWTGGGKNFVSDFIAKNLFKKGKNSTFLHWISGPSQFPDSYSSPHRQEEQLSVYKKQLRDIVTGNVSKCGRQLFVIDEVDKIPNGVIDAIKPFLDYNDKVNGVDYRKAIFIFLSNTGGKDISNITFEFWKKGKSRDEIKLKDLEPLINIGAFNEKGGLQGSHAIKNNVIDYYVPFLPLERKHVKLCIKDFIAKRYPLQVVDDSTLEEIADEMEYFPPDLKLYSRTGCKKVHTKVPLILRS